MLAHMPADFEKVMFEIYRDTAAAGRYRVVYFTELDEHNKDKEINDAMRGDHVFNGFLRGRGKDEGKQVVRTLIQRLNQGESLDQSAIERELKPFLA